jgi:hypothetical protein
MSTDPRLADPVILALAALRAKKSQETEPKRQVSLRVVYYDALGVEPLLEGPTYTYEVSDSGPAWRMDDAS